MKTFWVIFLFGCLFAVMSGADETPANRLLKGAKQKKSINRAPKLYDLKTSEARPIQSDTLLPRRVYLVFAPGVDQWIWTISTSSGKFSAPMEILESGAILNATLLGGMYAVDRYRLSDEGRWLPTDEDEHHNFIVLSDPPRRKWVAFNHPLPFAKHDEEHEHKHK